jgi:hypothetical protein
VAFAPETPRAVAQGLVVPSAGRRVVGDTVLLHGERSEQWVAGGERLVELVVNGEPVASQTVPADGKLHKLTWTVPVSQSSWVALRHFPQLHTNPVTVLVADQPIRASRKSAQWCVETIRLLWENREQFIAAHERDEARATFDRAVKTFAARSEEAARRTAKD